MASKKTLPDDEEEEVPETSDARRFFKEGQRFVTPINGDSTRGFYESLLVEKPHSHLAIRYCIENGIVSGEKHAVLLKKYYELKTSGIFNANRQAMQRIANSEGVKVLSPVKREVVKRELSSPESASKKVKKEKKTKKKEKKRKHSSSDSD